MTPALRAILLGGNRPALDLQFTSDSTVDSRITASGGAGGTRVNAAGLIDLKACPRIDYDPTTGAPLGVLIEEQRTNLVLFSEQFDNAVWSDISTGITTRTADAVVAPDGTITADKLVGNNANTWLSQNLGIGFASTTHSFSIYLRTDVTCSIELKLSLSPGVSYTKTVSLTSSWQRFTFTQTFAAVDTGSLYAGINIGNGNVVYAWGAQDEAASFATSYIPTTAAAVVRTADALTMTGASLNWFNAAQGTFVAEFAAPYLSATPPTRGVISGGDSARLAYIPIAPDGVYSYDGVSAVSPASGVIANGAIHKVASAYISAAERRIAVDGGTVATIGSCAAGYTSFPTFIIGSLAASQLNGYIRRIRYWRTRLPDATLQNLTT